MTLRNQKCKICAEDDIPPEAVKNMNGLYKLFHIDCPTAIPGKM